MLELKRALCKLFPQSWKHSCLKCHSKLKHQGFLSLELKGPGQPLKNNPVVTKHGLVHRTSR